MSKIKKSILIIITILILAPLAVSACDLQVESVYPNYDINNNATITTLNKVFGVKLNDNDQKVTYEVTINNTCNETATITDTSLQDSSFDFIKYAFNGIKAKDTIPGNSQKVIFLEVGTNDNGLTNGVQEEYNLNLDYTFDETKEDNKSSIIEDIINPDTLTAPILAITIFIITLIVITIIKNNKKPTKFTNLLLIISFSLLFATITNAYDTKKLVIRGIINFDNSSTKNKYKVTIDPNGGKLNKRSDKYTFLVEEGTTLDLSDTLKEKNTLVNWTSEDNTYTNNVITINSSQNLKANWEHNKHKLIIDLNGGTIDSSQDNLELNIDEDSTYNLKTPTKEHYKFYGWVETTNTESLNGNTITMKDKDVSVKAVWVDDTDEEFVITLNTNGGEISEKYVIRNRGQKYDLPIPTKEGYSFIGWYTEKDEKINSTDIFNLIENQTLYARWNVNSYNLTLDYATTGKTNKVIKIEYNSTFKDLEVPTKTGYIFEGWFDKDNKKIESDTIYDKANDQTIYARWTAKSYKLNFDANGGVVSDNYKLVKYNENFGELPTPRRTGYEFVGWYTNETNGTLVNNDSKYIIDSDQTIYAHWKNSKETPYIVKHWIQNIDGDSKNHDSSNYTLKDTDSLIGETDTNVSPHTNNYLGFTSPDEITEKISAEGNTIINYYYTRNQYTLTINTTFGVEEIEKTKKYSYEEKVNIDYKILEGYEFDKITGDITDTKFTMPANDIEITINAKPKKFNIIFDANGGDGVDKALEVTYNDTYKYLPTATRIGYEFIGWYTDSINGEKIENDTKVSITKDQTLYAHWEANSYIVNFDPNGGSLEDSINTKLVTYDENYGEMPTSNKDGYEFIGWYTDPSNGEKITSSSKVSITKMITLYAHYSPKQYTITFDGQGGTPSKESIKVTYDSAIGTLPTAIKEGYNFIGWLDESGNEITELTIYNKTENSTLYADYSKNQFKVTYNPNGGMIDEQSKLVTYDEKYGELPTPTKNGYKFIGWYTDENFTTKITENTIVKTSQNHTIIANWEVNNYILTYDAVGGTLQESSKTITFDSKYGELPTPTKEGYKFIGWYSDKKYTNEITSSTKVTEYKDHTIYAKWEENKYLITLDSRGGNEITDQIEVTYNKNYPSLPTPTKEGYSFIGWYDEYEVQIDEDTIVTKARDHTLHAKYEAKTYYVTFDENGGTLSTSTNTQPVTYDEKYGELPTSTKPGYTFIGWYDEDDNKISEDTIVKITKNQILTAKYDANKYEITFNSLGGKIDIDKIEVTYDSVYGTLPIPTKEGYSFVGWYDDSDNKITSVTQVKITKNTELKAKYTANEYEINFNPVDGSTNINNKKVTYDSEYGELPVPIKTGYSFIGWYDDSSQKITSNAIVKVAANQTLTARYEVNTYKVTLEPNGGTTEINELNITFEANYSNLPTPTKEGYTFDGWYDDSNNNVTEQTQMLRAENHTLYAKWTANKYLIKFNTNNGEEIEEKEVTYNEKIGELPIAKKEGYTFSSWYKDSKLTEEITSDDIYKYTSSITLYAKYTPNEYLITFDSVDGTLTSQSNTKVVTYDSEYGELPSAIKTGYTFIGWFNSDNEEIKSSDIVNIISPQILTAKYTPNKYEITLDPKEGSVTPNKTEVTFDSNYGTLPEAEREGYTFIGWFNSDDEQILESTKVQITSNDTLYAKYSNTAYKITFDSKEGTVETKNKLVEYDKEYGTLPIPEREGYIFNGWYTSEEFNDDELIKEDTIVKITGSQTLYAKYTIKTFKVSFDSRSGADVDTIMTVTWGTTFGELPQTSKTGYTFTGWYKSHIGDDIVKSDTIVDDLGGDITLYAHWEANKYTLNYNSVCGTITNNTKEITYDQEIGELEIPSKTGYKFVNWYKEYDYQNIISETDIFKETNDITIYAKWEANKYNLIYNPNGGIITNNAKEITYNEKIGTLETPIKNGYTFIGWYDDNDEQITEETIVNKTEDITIKAKYIANKYTITLEPNGGTIDNNKIEVEYDNTYNDLPTPTKTGYTFDGWYTENIDGDLIKNTDIVKISENKTLYAHYTANKYTVTLDTNGGIADTDQIEVTYGQTYSNLPKPTKEGYRFKGWYLNNGGTSQVVNSTKVTKEEDHTLYAEWIPNTNTIYTVNHYIENLNSNSEIKDDNNYTLKEQELLTGVTDETVYPETKEYEGFTSPSTESIKILPDGSATINYYYTRNSYNLVINTDTGIINNTKSNKYQYEEQVNIEYTVADGYTYNGITGDFDSTKFNMPAKDANITITASANKYTIYFDAMGSSVTPNTKEVVYNESYDELPTPETIEGYIFKGWYKDKTYSEEVKSSDIVDILENITLYAKWTPVVSTLIFDAGRGSEVNDVITITYDSTYGKLPTTTRPGYDFAGWYTEVDGGEEITENTVVKTTSNQTLYAHWTLAVESKIKKVSANETSAYFKYKDKIKSITFIDDIIAPDKYIESWDISENTDESVIAYLKENEADEELTDEELKTYDVIIAGYEKITANEDSSNLFRDMKQLEKIDNINILNVDNVKNMANMFYQTASDSNEFNLDLSAWNTENVTNMSAMFYATGANSQSVSINTTNFNTSNVTDMSQMFAKFATNASSANIDTTNFNTANVITMYQMFYYTGTNSSDIVINTENFNTPKLTNAYQMFYKAGENNRNFELKLTSGFDTSNVQSTAGMFAFVGSNNESFTLDVSNLDTRNVTDMNTMFFKTGEKSKVFELNFSDKFQTLKVSNMASMFTNAGANNESFTLDVSKFATSSVQDMSRMFEGTGKNSKVFNLDVSNWNTSNVTNMSGMFYQAGEASEVMTLDVSNWNTSKVTNMKNLFNRAGASSTVFTLNVSNWTTSSVKDMEGMFAYAGYSNPNFTLTFDSSKFRTNSVSSIASMFEATGYNSKVFKLDLSGFNTSNVTNMSNTFKDAGYNSEEFEIILSNTFTTARTSTTVSMFENAGYSNPSFTLDVSNFKTNTIQDMSRMFYHTGNNNENMKLDLSSFTLNSSKNLNEFVGSDAKIKLLVSDSTTLNLLTNNNYQNAEIEIKQ